MSAPAGLVASGSDSDEQWGAHSHRTLLAKLYELPYSRFSLRSNHFRECSHRITDMFWDPVPCLNDQ
ncbi:hypothetical protein P3T73_12390 [Kiritimatiellota bacterium B12222]|nr:hypothetical protein P3T73_12390 [Kiritimatiellota bacterium B12222]